MQLDPQYRSLTRDRQHAAATKTRVMQVIDDPRNLLMRPLPSAYTKRKVSGCSCCQEFGRLGRPSPALAVCSTQEVAQT